MLSDLIGAEVFAFFIIFVRMGAAFAYMPGYGAAYVPATVRLVTALAVTAISVPLILPHLPAPPEDLPTLTLMIITEALIGLFLGLIMNVILAALHLAGTQIGYSIGLANAFAQDPVSMSQSAIMSSFLDLTGLTLIFVTGLHLVMIEAVVDSYVLMSPREAPMIQDMTRHVVESLVAAFKIGLKLASPFVVFAIVFQSAMGLISRLMPQLNIFFIALPLQMMAGLSLLIIVLPTMMMVFLEAYQDSVMALSARAFP